MNCPPSFGSEETSEVSLPLYRLDPPASSTTPIPYRYTPLNEAAHEIRIVELLPGSVSEIRVCLHIMPFNENHIPDFEALSYAWGSQENPVNIFVGKTAECTLAVTMNLAEALPYLRFEHESRFLWIDAISVNQQDTEERSTQVQRMAEIYSNASKVLVWLGPESKDSSVALRCLRKAVESVEVDWELLQLCPLTLELHWADVSCQMDFQDEEYLAICNFLNRNWFYRLWIWQEVRLAKHAIVLCGQASIEWAHVRVTLFCLWVKAQSHIVARNLSSSHLRTLKNLSVVGGLNLIDLIDWTKQSLCSDPRDRIFALLSMLPPYEHALKIVPDYSKSAYEIYREMAVQMITISKLLNVLTSVELREGVTDTCIGAPTRGATWVPDWSVQRETTPLQLQSASGMSRSTATFTENGDLLIHGRIIGIVGEMEAFGLDNKSHPLDDTVLELHRVAGKLGLRKMIEAQPDSLLELCRVLCSDRFNSSFWPHFETFPRRAESLSFLNRLLYQLPYNPRGMSVSMTSDEIMFLCVVHEFGSMRTLFRSTNGHFGIGPTAMRAGDIITVLLGCRSAMILRPALNGKFMVVGETCCSGAMDGDALLGPLNGSVISRYSETHHNRFWAFLDSETEEWMVEDPRLAGVPLPVGWRRKEHRNEELFSCFVNVITGEEQFEDPRMGVEELRGRGVEIQEFVLV